MNKMYDKAQFFLAYFARATEKELVVRSLTDRFMGFKDSVSILDLGCHDGSLLERILNTYQSRLPARVDIVGVDPSETALGAFRQKMANNGHQVDTFIGCAEEYFKDSARHHDWILASQCLYWSADLSAVLKDIHERGDASLVVLRGKKGIFEIQSRFRSLIGDQEERLYSSSDIEDALYSLNIPFAKEDHATEIHVPKSFGQESKWINAFFLEVSDDALSDENHSEIAHFIAGLGSPMRHDITLFWLKGANTPC